MDKVSTRFMRGRLKIAVLIAVCLIVIVAMPATAFAATFTNMYPAGTLHMAPTIVGAVVFGGFKAGTASIKIGTNSGYTGQTAMTTYTNLGSVSGHWTSSEVQKPDGTWKIVWAWVADAEGDQATVYCFPTVAAATSEGNHYATVSVTNPDGVTTSSQNFTYRIDGFTISALLPANNVSVGTTSPAVQFTVSSTSTISAIQATINGSSATLTSSGTRYTVAVPAAGLPDNAVSNVSVDVTTTAGYRADANWSFTVNTTGSTGCLSCHIRYDKKAGMGLDCEDCHSLLDGTPDHYEVLQSQFSIGQASRHNVNESAWSIGGDRGALTKFDGTYGVLLKSTTGTTVTAEWDLPEVNVFWAADATTTGEAPSTAITGLDWDSVVRCQDCHTGFIPSGGPHGATATWRIDPSYPAPYRYAILGANKGTTMATSTSGIKFRTDRSDIPGFNEPDNKTVIADGTRGQYAVICAKCHDLFNKATGCDGWSNAYSEQSAPGAPQLLDEASPESIHGMHAGGTNSTATSVGNQGRTDGRSDCVACHIGIPHGWKRPRLLVNSYTGPYNIGGGWPAQPGYAGPAIVMQSVADPAPYWIGRGQQWAAGMSAGNGPIDADEPHLLNEVDRVPVWSEQRCISCAGSLNGGLEHSGFTTQPAKLK